MGTANHDLYQDLCQILTQNFIKAKAARYWRTERLSHRFLLPDDRKDMIYLNNSIISFLEHPGKGCVFLPKIHLRKDVIMKRVAIYVRVSTQEQATEGYSIQEQTERLTKYCEAHGWTVSKVYTDPGYSGSNMNRPALQALFKDAEKKYFDLVLVYKLDRLSRSQKDTLFIIEDVFLKKNIEFISMNENFDTSTPFGRAMIGILSVFAQLEREQIKERMGMGKEARAKEGKWGGGSTVPVGYRYNSADDMLYIDDYEAMQVREAYDLFLQGLPYKTISDQFTQKGYTYTGRSGHTGQWDPKRLKYVLTNKLYIGYIRHHNQWFPGDHEPIIDTETFNKAQSLFAKRVEVNDKFKKKRQGQTTYLGGLLFCSHCGARYAKQAGRKWKDHEPPLYYVCYSRNKKVPKMIKDPNCQNKNWKMKDLDNAVMNEIRKLAVNPKCISEIQQSKSAKTDVNVKINIIKNEIQKLNDQISRFLDLYGTGIFTIEQVGSKINLLNEQKQQLEQELNAITSQADLLSEAEAAEIVKSFETVLENGNFDEIRLIIDSLIRYIELDGDDIIIHWRFA